MGRSLQSLVLQFILAHHRALLDTRMVSFINLKVHGTPAPNSFSFFRSPSTNESIFPVHAGFRDCPTMLQAFLQGLAKLVPSTSVEGTMFNACARKSKHWNAATVSSIRLHIEACFILELISLSDFTRQSVADAARPSSLLYFDSNASTVTCNQKK